MPPPGVQLYSKLHRGGAAAAMSGATGARASQGVATAVSFPPSQEECKALLGQWSTKFLAFMAWKKDPGQKDAWQATLNPIYK
jgi:hypothetical protein